MGGRAAGRETPCLHRKLSSQDFLNPPPASHQVIKSSLSLPSLSSHSNVPVRSRHPGLFRYLFFLTNSEFFTISVICHIFQVFRKPPGLMQPLLRPERPVAPRNEPRRLRRARQQANRDLVSSKLKFFFH